MATKNLTEEQVEENKKKYPSYNEVYEISLKTYDWALKRLDTWDGNLDKTLAWGSALGVGVFALLVKQFTDKNGICTLSFSSFWFILAAASFVTAVGFAIWGKRPKKIWEEDKTELEEKKEASVSLLSPQVLYDKWLIKDEFTFKCQIIQASAKHLEHNTALIERKSTATFASSLAFAVQAIALFIWAI